MQVAVGFGDYEDEVEVLEEVDKYEGEGKTENLGPFVGLDVRAVEVGEVTHVYREDYLAGDEKDEDEQPLIPPARLFCVGEVSMVECFATCSKFLSWRAI